MMSVGRCTFHLPHLSLEPANDKPFKSDAWPVDYSVRVVTFPDTRHHCPVTKQFILLGDKAT